MSLSSSYNNSLPLKGVLFDLDGTLTNTDLLHYKAYSEILLNYNYVLTHDEYNNKFSGLPNKDIMNIIFPNKCVDEQNYIVNQKEAKFRDLSINSLIPLDNAIEFLNYLKLNSIFIACVTNAPRINAEYMLKGLKLDNFFDILIIGEECKEMKPSPIPYLNAIDEFCAKSLINKSDLIRIERQGKSYLPFIVFEDSFSGIKAGNDANCFVYGVSTTHSIEKLSEVCYNVIKDYKELNFDRIINLDI